jgi:uncharacterized Zn-binding protein involved in type VI secretion
MSRGPVPLVVATDPAAQIAALQQQVAALQAQVQALQVKTQFVSSNGSDYTLNVPGNVTISSAGVQSTPSKVLIRSNQAVEIMAGSNLDMRASSSASLWAAGGTTVRGDGGTTILGATVQINRNGAPAATVGSTTSPAAAGTPAKVLTGSSTVMIGN